MDNGIRDCEQLVYDFAWHIDHHEARQAADLFAIDAVFDRRGEALNGRQAILAAFLARPASVTTRHLCTNLRFVAESATRIRATSYFELYRHQAAATTEAQTTAPLTGPEFIGEYHDQFIRTDEGWRFASRIAKPIFQRG